MIIGALSASLVLVIFVCGYEFYHILTELKNLKNLQQEFILNELYKITGTHGEILSNQKEQMKILKAIGALQIEARDRQALQGPSL